ncbi:MAG TPA: nuclear transport factor 2 family protein [bacterium]|jgi:ketosteroid isomerase-like protein
MDENIAKQTALQFIEAINRQSPDDIAALMTDEHTFIDTENEIFTGREQMHNGWIGYYKLFPDYTIKIDELSVRGDLVIISGQSDGTLSDFGKEVLSVEGEIPDKNTMQGKAIWTAKIDGDKVAEWRVYWDTDDVRKSLGILPYG